MGPVGADRGVAVDPEAPGLVRAVAAHPCAGTAPHLVGMRRVPRRRDSGRCGPSTTSTPFNARSTSRAAARRAGPLGRQGRRPRVSPLRPHVPHPWGPARNASLAVLANVHASTGPNSSASTHRQAVSKAHSDSGSGGRFGSRAQPVRRDRWITGEVEPVLPVVGLAHAYPRTNLDERGRHRLALGQHD